MATVTNVKPSTWDQYNFDKPELHLQDDYLSAIVHTTLGRGLNTEDWATLIVATRDSMIGTFPDKWEELALHFYANVPFIPSFNYIRAIHPEGEQYGLKTVMRHQWYCLNTRRIWREIFNSNIVISPAEFINVTDFDTQQDTMILNYIATLPWPETGVPFENLPQDIMYAIDSNVDFTDLVYVFRTSLPIWFREETEKILAANFLEIDYAITLPFFPMKVEFVDVMYIISHIESIQPATKTSLTRKQITTDW